LGVVGGDIAPSVQFTQVSHALGVRWIGCVQFKGEAEAFKIRTEALDVRVAPVEGPMGPELRLDQGAEPRPDPGHDNLGAFRVKVAAEPLEVGAKQENVPSQVLVSKAGIRGCQAQGCGALGIDKGKVGHAVVLPLLQGSRGHG
jgi:hypothetical protein